MEGVLKGLGINMPDFNLDIYLSTFIPLPDDEKKTIKSDPYGDAQSLTNYPTQQESSTIIKEEEKNLNVMKRECDYKEASNSHSFQKDAFGTGIGSKRKLTEEVEANVNNYAEEKVDGT